MMQKILVALWTFSLLALPAHAAADPRNDLREQPMRLDAAAHGVGRLAPDVTWTDIHGEAGRLSDLIEGGQGVVIAFNSTTCPLSRRFAPTLAGLEKQFAGRGVRFLFINPLATDPRKEMNELVLAHGFTGPYVHDAEGRLAAALGATATTDALLIDAGRTVVYHGAVNDQYGLGYALDAPRHNYLADTIEAMLDGKRPAIRATTAPGCALALEPKPGKTPGGASDSDSGGTYHNRISRIVQDNCLTCHRDGGVGPFSLASYDDVLAHAGMIGKVVDRGIMPPWFAAPPEVGHLSLWANDRTLPPGDKADLLAWLASDRPIGDPADAPLPRKFHSEWQIGEPDVVLQLPEAIAVKATGTMPYQNVQVRTDFAEDRWVRAVEVKPTAPGVVHHVLVFAIPRDSERPAGVLARLRERRRSGGGGLRGRGRIDVDERTGYFGVYVPGTSAISFPDGLARKLPAGATLHFQIHYTPNGTATQDQTQIGFIFDDKPPRHEIRVAGIANARLNIPPGAANHAETAMMPVPMDLKLTALVPHMHVRGKAFRYDLVLPGGERKVLLDIPRYDFNWQLRYELAEPLAIPAGSRIEVTAWYDNSSDNPANPDPTRTVKWGPQTYDEMLLGYVEYHPAP